MKNINKFLMTAMIAVMTLLSSCIKTEVAPEVTALRQAQLDLLTAKTEMQNLQNEAQSILNDYQAALNAIALQQADLDLQEQASNLEVLLANNAALLVEAEADLAEAQLALEQALDDMAEYLAEHGLDEAAMYLADYASAMDDYYGSLYDIAEQEAHIASLELFQGAAWDHDDDALTDDLEITFALLAQIIERDLAETQFELDAANAVLTALQAVQDDPTALIAEIATAYATIEDLKNANEDITNNIEDYEASTVATAWNAWKMAVGGPAYYSLGAPGYTGNNSLTYSGVKPDYEAAEAAAEGYEMAIETNEAVIDVNNTLINDWILDGIAGLEASLTDAEALLETYEGDAAATYTVLLAADNAWTNALNDLLIAAENEFPNNTDVNAYLNLLNNLDNAQMEYDLAVLEDAAAKSILSTVGDTYTADLADLDAILTTANNDLTTADNEYGNAYNTWVNDVSTANLALLNTAEVALRIAEANQAKAQDDRDALVQLWIDLGDDANNAAAAEASTASDLGNAQDAYDNYVADDPAFYAAVDAAIADERAALATAIEEYVIAEEAYNIAVELRDSAQGLVDDIIGDAGTAWTLLYFENQLDIRETNVATAEDNIAQATADLADEQAIMDALQTAYDAIDEVALGEAYSDAAAMMADMSLEQAANNEMIEGLWQLLDVLEGNIDNVNGEIEDILDEIETLTADIQALEKMLEDNVISEEEFTAQLDAENVYLDMLMEEADAYLMLADEYMALYLAAIGG